MGKLFKNLKPYWSSVLLILVLLVVQAFCDLSLPQYTSDIIDTGIQNSGVEHILPEQITAEEFENAQLFMTESEKQKWQNAYDGEQRKESLSGKDLDELDSDLLVPVLLNYQMSMMSEDSFREMLAQQQTDPNAAAQMEQMTVEELGAAMGVELQPFQRTEEDSDGNSSTVTCVDVRPVFAAMQQSGQLNEDTVTQMRSQLEDMLDTMGDSLVQSMGVAYAVQCDKDAGLDIDKIQTSYLWRTGSKMMAMAFAMMAAAICVCYVASRVGAGVGRDLRGKVFSRVMQFSSAEMDQFSTASLITRSTNDIQQVQMVTAIFLRMLLYAPILGIGGVLKVVHTGAGMGWVIVLAVLVILGIVGVLMAIAMPKFQKMQVLVDKVNLVSREILTGLSVIRAFGREKTEEERFDKANRDLTKTNLFVNRVMTFMMPVMMLIMYSLTILIVWVGSHRIDGGSMQVGSMTAFITYAMMIVMSFLMLTMMSVMLPRGSVAAKRIDEVLQTKTSVQETAQPKHLQDSKGVLTFDHVCFRYPHAEENALTDLCFTAKPNQTTAIIGSTGCGKSTLVNLIPRLYDVTAGSITLDGVELRDLPLEELRQQIGFVPQKGVLFSGTIASNLRFGNPDASDAEVQQAAEIAQAMEFIQEKPDRFDSTIAQGGTNVSGGQKQRLCIARALLKKPKILILDDSTSAVDTHTDACIRQALRDEIPDTTKFIIAQRVTSLMDADRIIVLDEGRIDGIGTHEELLKNNAIYREVYESQQKGSVPQ